MTAKAAGITIENGYVPGLIGRIVGLHGRYYHRNWHFGPFFEAKVAGELADFIGRYDPQRDGLWRVMQDRQIQGSLIIDGARARTRGAHLRWFIVSDSLRGRGAGRMLLEQALQFCGQKQYPKVYLWTFKGLDRARHLYASVGFELVREQTGRQWGTQVVEQYFELNMPVA